jgi:hypothetical protein
MMGNIEKGTRGVKKALASHMPAFYFVPSFLVALLVTIASSPSSPPSLAFSLLSITVTVVVVESGLFYFYTTIYYIYIYPATSGPPAVVRQLATMCVPHCLVVVEVDWMTFEDSHMHVSIFLHDITGLLLFLSKKKYSQLVHI